MAVFMDDQSGSSTQTPNNDTTEFDYDDFDPEAFALEAYKIRFFLSTVKRDLRYLFGHQLEDMLIQCSYHDAKCSADKNFTEFDNQKYGNCYTFNKEVTADSVSKSGPVHGVKLLLNAETDEYSQITDAVGFKLVIHPPDQMPFPEDEGVLVSPGFSTSIAVSKLDIKRTEAPYGRCVNYGKNDHLHLNMYADLFDVGYSDKACHRTCFQRAMVDDCECCHRDFPCYITTVNDEQLDVNFCNYTDPVADKNLGGSSPVNRGTTLGHICG
ncbi:degenerin unc-8-like [Littorina saxatilis]|uniref:degenerin unc-8-like n=1 Tax=Littorina saxatilis TaxID=31220 RepID=UPI0038B4C964